MLASQTTLVAVWRTTIAVLFLACPAIVMGAGPGDWPQWRGPADTGSIDKGTYPSQFTSRHLLWEAKLPGKGCSTPILVGKQLYVTAPIDGRDALVAFDASGKRLWQATFGAEVAGKHRNGSGCNASPTSDGEAIFVYFKSGTLAAVDLNGKVRWQTNLVERFGKDTLFWDHGTSPVLTDKHVVMARMHKGESWLAAFDKRTGEISWKVARNYETPVECDHGYSTPLVMEHQGEQVLLVWGAQHLTMHRAKDGEVVWTCGGFNPDGAKLWPSIATPVVVDGVAIVAYGRNDRGIPRLHGIKLSGSGDVTATNRLWLRDDIGTFVPSPVAYQGKVYLVRDKGEVECIEPATGETVWSAKFPKGRGNYYASPLLAGDKLFAPREDGMVFVASVADGRFELLAENDMGESVIASPIPSGNRIIIRGVERLFCYE